MQRIQSLWIRCFGVAAIAGLWACMYGGCFTAALSLECYKCPCGSPDYACEQGYCIHNSNKASLGGSPVLLAQYIQERCISGASEGGGNIDGGGIKDTGGVSDQAGKPDVPVVIPDTTPPCPAGQVRDPATGQCQPSNPNTLCPDGTQPTAGRCAVPCSPSVICPDRYDCDPQSGLCVPNRCDTNPNICISPKCCNQNIGVCTDFCTLCNRCPGNLVCDPTDNRCKPQVSSCQPSTLACAENSECCGRQCLIWEERRNGQRYTARACSCTSNTQCSAGRQCRNYQNRQICSCAEDSDCGARGTCESVGGGIRVCMQRRP